VDDFFESQLVGIDSSNVKNYIQSIREEIDKDNFIPPAPSNYTTIIPKEGLILNFEGRLDLSNIHYQAF
jgi:hypothetical protein